MKITLEVSTETESTSSPWWTIIDPKQNLRVDTSTDNQPLHDIASMITGPFFSRKEAEDYLQGAKHHFSKNAKVFCHSGNYSRQYDSAYREARKRERENAAAPSSPSEEPRGDC